MKRKLLQIQWAVKVLAFFILAGCTDEIEMPEVASGEKLVVDAWITTQPGPYQIKLTRTLKFNELPFEDYNTYGSGMDRIGVADAQVTISDDTGFTEVLQKESHNTYGYVTSNLVPKPGRTYFLKIVHKGKEYTATAYMPPVPAIEKTSYFFRPTEIEGKFDQYVPLVFFHEPQHEKNYYLFKYCGAGGCGTINSGYSNSRVWNVSIMNDDLMPPYLNGLSVDDGQSVSGSDFYLSRGTNTVQMYSLTKEAYLFYESLIRQFQNDGGTYQPAPASAPSNISNGALGFFGAAAVSEANVEIPY
ncbi:MAG: DUF4249 domain-containing protein [Rufibacter sp.]